MRVALRWLNSAAALFSLWWFIAHVQRQVGDWEFWFALIYLVVTTANAVYFVRRQPAAPAP
jgi:hypothetical protein